MKIGDHVECKHDQAWQDTHQARDIVKMKKLGKKEATFKGNAAAYMRLDEAYVVIGFNGKNGVLLRGFAPAVSSKDIQPSTKPVYR